MENLKYNEFRLLNYLLTVDYNKKDNLTKEQKKENILLREKLNLIKSNK